VLGAAGGALLALLPLVAAAQEEGSRALDPSGADWARVMLFAFAGMIGIMLVATLGYLYRRRRNIVWDFQQPETPHHDAH
jgi:LPXTG-motif cell wall-anchored protein